MRTSTCRESHCSLALTTSAYLGTGYVTGFDQATDKVTFTVPSTTTRLYDLTIRVAAIYGDKRTTVILNNGASSEVFFAAGTTFVNVAAGQVLLNQGSNTIDLVSNWGWYLIDSITVTPSAPRPAHQINASPVNANANADAKALYKYLRSIYGKKILSGQQELSWSNWIAQQTGKTPALVSVDLMDYSPSRVERGTVGTSVEEAITHATRGGIVSVLWHWNAPTGLYDTEAHKWWSGFYTDATDFNVATALADTTNANYTLLIRDIDAIAVQLKRLQTAGVPVLFRPLHEAEGKWFWWGAQGAEPCKKLWGILYDRLTNYHGINNLLWVWNSLAADWYPGDATIDILSADVYAQGNGVSIETETRHEQGNRELTRTLAHVDPVQPAHRPRQGQEDDRRLRGRRCPPARPAPDLRGPLAVVRRLGRYLHQQRVLELAGQPEDREFYLLSAPSQDPKLTSRLDLRQRLRPDPG